MTTQPTFSSGSGVLTFHKNRVLLVQLNYGDFKGHWILPGGMLEKGEHPHQGAIREFKEETNLNVKIDRLITVRNRLNEHTTNNIYFVFSGKITNTNPENEIQWPNEELQSVKFWDIEECLNDDSVRPHTKNYINTILSKSKPKSIQRFEGKFNDFVYVV